jgi:Trk-type K+ transport system membrane component
VKERLGLANYFLDTKLLFTLPALALIFGITFIYLFIWRTSNKIAAKKAVEAAKSSKKVA